MREGSKYYISKHRYLELKHFCLQYNEWQKRKSIATYKTSSIIDLSSGTGSEFIDRTGDAAIDFAEIDRLIGMIEKAARESDLSLSKYLFLAVTQGLSFNTLKAVYNIPCERNVYYDKYRKLFWMLDKIR